VAVDGAAAHGLGNEFEDVAKDVGNPLQNVDGLLHHFRANAVAGQGDNRCAHGSFFVKVSRARTSGQPCRANRPGAVGPSV